MLAAGYQHFPVLMSAALDALFMMNCHLAAYMAICFDAATHTMRALFQSAGLVGLDLVGEH
jgi:hypothetical protein